MSYARPFSIQLDQPRTTYTAGDRLTGNVILNSTQDESVGNVIITLFARAKAKIFVQQGDHRKIVRSRATLLETSQTLYSSHFTLRPDKYVWPFSFTIPGTPQKHTESEWEAGQGFEYMAGHPLPPTMSYTGTNMLGSRRFECFTEYMLKAKLTRPPQDKGIFSLNSDLDSEFPLFFEMVSPVSSAAPQTISHFASFTTRSLLLDPSHPSSLTFKEKMRSTFKSSTLPAATFDLTLIFPTSINLGAPLHIRAQLTHRASDSTAPTTPPITLRNLSIQLTRHISVRSPRTFLSTYHRSSSETTFEQSFPPRPFTPDSNYTLDTTTAILDPRTCNPGFRTYNISQHHSIKVSCTLTCADKTHETSTEALFTINPRFRMAQSGTTSGEVGEELPEYTPAYTEAEGSSTGGRAEAAYVRSSVTASAEPVNQHKDSKRTG